jgi:hypothetical protein
MTGGDWWSAMEELLHGLASGNGKRPPMAAFFWDRSGGFFFFGPYYQDTKSSWKTGQI